MPSNKNGDDFSSLFAPSPVSGSSIVTGSEELAAEARRLGFGAVVSKHLDRGKVYLVKEPESFGVLPVRSELTVLPADAQKDMAIGWKITETVGIGVFNPRGLGRLSADRELVLIETPVPGFPDHRIRAVWTVGGTRAESVRKRGSKDQSVVLGIIDEAGFVPSEDPKSYGLRPNGPQWDDFVREASRLHVAASVMES
jgi:hypothetical protein